MSEEILIIGSNSTGLQASLDLADMGVNVHLVERRPFLGRNGAAPIPEHLYNTRLLEVYRHPNIRVWNNTWVTSCEGELGEYQVELSQEPRYVDISRCTACGACIEVCPVTVPGTEHKAIYLDGQPGCMTIDKYGVAPCAGSCPGGIHVQGYVALIARGRFQEAIDLIRDAIPFPGICGRVCTHPCEINCRRNQIDNSVAVRLLKRFVSDWELEQDVQKSSNTNPQKTIGGNGQQIGARNPKRVAVVGAGPGGMTVAERLSRLGHHVTIFEKLPVIGGMMAIGIPGYRLPRAVISREYQQIQALGVEIQLNTTIGPDGDHTLDELFELGYQAVCLAVGAHQGQTLGIPGEELPGVVQGIEVLKNINLSQQLDDPKYRDALGKNLVRGSATRTVVIGGGNTAMDVSRSLKRFGIQDVTVLYRRTRTEMPASTQEVEDAEVEGVHLEFLVAPVRVLGDSDNRVIGLDCMRMELGAADKSGRRRPVPIQGSNFSIDVDLVVLAVGQKPELSFLESENQFVITQDGHIHIGEADFMTSHPGVFALGDAVTRDKMAVIEAIGMGIRAAKSIDLYLNGLIPPVVLDETRDTPVSNRNLTPAELQVKNPTPVPKIPIDHRMTTFSEVELGFTAAQAVQEAQRCLACGPCSECMACVEVCEPNAIIHDQRNKLEDIRIGSIILTGSSAAHNLHHKLPKSDGIFQLSQDDPLSGSAIAIQSLLALRKNQVQGQKTAREDGGLISSDFSPWTSVQSHFNAGGPHRYGVFICECGGQISKYIDTLAIRNQSASWPGVIHAQALSFACSPEGARSIKTAIETHKLDRVVLAGCSCCSIDQICYCCTFQRVRCKDQLELFANPERSSIHATQEQTVKFVLVNIREQCAWIHTNDRTKGTAKAVGLVGASVARAMSTTTHTPILGSVVRSALICGDGEAGQQCMSVLKACGVDVSLVGGHPDQIYRSKGQYILTLNGRSYDAKTLIMAPKDSKQWMELQTTFGSHTLQPRITADWNDVETHRPGIYYLNPARDPFTSGCAGASRSNAWMSRLERGPVFTSQVNPTRCRACGTCVEICEYGAPQLIEENGQGSSWIDPAICTSCGTCVAHCPSGAITAGYSTDSQIEAMLSVLLSQP